MKTKINFLIIFTLCALSAVSQINVKTNGRVKIGQGSIAPVSQLEIQDVNHTTECRIFATTNDIARLWTMNHLYAIGLGVGTDGIPHIYTNVNAPFESVDFGWNQFKFNFYNSTSINIEYLSTMTVRPGSAHTGYIGSSTYPWAGVYSDNYYKTLPLGDGMIMTPINQDPDLVTRLNNLNGIQYSLVPTERTEQSIRNEKNSTGFSLSANEVLVNFPGLVVLDTLTNQYFIDYVSFIPILLEAYKSQKLEILKLEQQISTISNSQTNNLEKLGVDGQEVSALYQNSPNPFKVETKVNYYLSSKMSSGSLALYTLSGEQIKSFRNLSPGNGEIVIKGAELKPGMYLYSLIVDNQVIDTKRMVLTD